MSLSGTIHDETDTLHCAGPDLSSGEIILIFYGCFSKPGVNNFTINIVLK